MTQTPNIHSIYTSSNAGSKMVSKDKVKLVKGIGMKGIDMLWVWVLSQTQILKKIEI